MNAFSTAAFLTTALAGSALAGPVLTIQAGVGGYATQTVSSSGVDHWLGDRMGPGGR
jgi:hypothetical protein